MLGRTPSYVRHMAIRLPHAPKPEGARKGRRAPRPVLVEGPHHAPLKGPRINTQGNQVIPEQASIVGDKTGKVYATLAEGGHDERVIIKPIGRKYAPKTEKGAVQRYETGGEVRTATFDEWGRPLYDPVTDTNYGYSGPPIGSQQPANQSPVINTQGSATVNAPVPTNQSNPNYGAQGNAIYAAENEVFGARKAQIDLGRDLIPIQASVNAASRGAVAASTKAIEEQGRALGASSAYLDEQARASAASEAETRAIDAAAGNVADKAAVARALKIRSVNDEINIQSGVGADVEVDVPNGADNGFVLPPGTRAKLQTQEELKTAAAKDAAELRAFGIERARVASARAGNTAAAASNVANLEQNKVSAAQVEVEAARLGLTLAGLTLEEKRLAVDQAKQPPMAGLVYNAATGTFVTPEQDAVITAQQTVNQGTYDPVNKEYVTAQQLRDRTDADGNIRRNDGVLVDPKTMNELGADGVWTDPATGNRFVDGIWRAPNGDMFIRDIWQPPHYKYINQGGVWWTDDGFVLQDSGVWYNPKTGDYRRWDGQQWVKWGGSGGPALPPPPP